jgi:pyruvate dehydrogenase E2 component (dihydrolipoamide acetyltransferase)
LAQERGIDLTTVKGTGPHGRILERDLSLGQPASVVTFGRREVPHEKPGSYEEVPLSPIRKVIGQRLQEAKTFIPHFYETQEILADRLVHVRTELASVGLKVTYNDLVLRACALALREHPAVNSGFNSVNQSIIRFKTIDISVAVSLESGLITPIVRHADFKNVGQISTEVKSLATRAKEGKLSREEYTGGSFTVSNIGMFGITEFKAIINPPQAAILAVGGIIDQPIVKDGQVVPGKVMRVTLSADHRVLDGTDVAKFLKTLQQLLENPSLLLL